jgi:opacity protein-like surface antigen
MKKLVLALAVLVAVSGAVSALDLLQYPPPVEGGNIMVDLGIGLGGAGAGTSWGHEWQGNLLIPPIFGIVEYALPVKVPISVGGMFAYWMHRYQWSGTDHEVRNHFIAINGRGDWHWAFPVDWLDFYTGLSLGWQIHIWDTDFTLDRKPDWTKFDWGLQAGAHFYFTEKIGAMAEFGYPFFLKGGVALKF